MYLQEWPSLSAAKMIGYILSIGLFAATSVIKINGGRESHIASYHKAWHVLPRRMSCKERRRRIAGA
jgi:hypothetical protein